MKNFRTVRVYSSYVGFSIPMVWLPQRYSYNYYLVKLMYKHTLFHYVFEMFSSITHLRKSLTNSPFGIFVTATFTARTLDGCLVQWFHRSFLSPERFTLYSYPTRLRQLWRRLLVFERVYSSKLFVCLQFAYVIIFKIQLTIVTSRPNNWFIIA